jgi:hypothetical protein
VEIFGFNQLSVNDNNRLGGGVVVVVKDEINCVTRLDLQVGSVECIWLEIKINNKKYLYGTFYIPPNSGQQIWEELEQFIDLVIYYGDYLLTLGLTDELRSVTYVGSVIS